MGAYPQGISDDMFVPAALALATQIAAAPLSTPPVIPGTYADGSGRTLYAALDVESDGPQVNWLDPQRQTAGVTAAIPAGWRLKQRIFERRTIVQAPQGPLGVSLYYVDNRTRATVILIHGNDAQTREMGFLAPLYVLNGVNVVTYDQRGTGESAGSWHDNGPMQRAADVEAIYDAVASDPRVDPKRIGLWAFSNGGWTAPIVATQRPIAFMLLIGAPASTLQANIKYEVAQRVQRAGYDDAQIAQAVKLVSAMLAALDGTGSWETANALYAASKAHKWLPALGLKPNMTLPPPAPVLEGMRRADVFDPQPFLVRVTSPTLALYGAHDRAVDVAHDSPQLEADFKRAGMKDLTVKVYPGAGHSLFLSPTGYRDDTKPSWQLVPDYSTITIDWLRERSFLEPSNSQ